MISVYRRPRGFSRADSSSPGEYVNSDPGIGSGIDADIAGKHSSGICAGITTAWVIGVLNGVTEAATPSEFRAYFDNMLKFQGAYVFRHKIEQAISTSRTGMAQFLQPFVNAGVVPAVKQTKRESVRLVWDSTVPHGDWAAYTVIPGHAIGIAEVSGKYLVMDPNYGLHSYSDRTNFLLDLNYLYIGFRMCFGLERGELIELFFYEVDRRARALASSPPQKPLPPLQRGNIGSPSYPAPAPPQRGKPAPPAYPAPPPPRGRVK